MATLILKEDVQPLTSVFLPITLKYQWEEPGCLVYNAGGFLGIRVDVSFFADVSAGDFIQVLNGSYKGTYSVTSITSDSTYAYFVTGATWNGADSSSNLFNLDRKQLFELYAGYQSGAGQSAKPYQKIADIAVSINPITALFEVDLQAYLRTYYSITPPISGIDYGLSLEWELISIGGTAVVPTTSTITWELDQTFPVSAGLRITDNGVEQVNQLSNASGSFTSQSSNTIFIDTLDIQDDPNTGTVTLTVVNTTDATTVFTETKNKTDNNGRITFTFTVQRNKDYSIDVTTAT